MNERYSDHVRARNMTVSFRLTPEEYRQMQERIVITGLPKAEFMIRSMLEQQIGIRAGKFESDRLSLEIKRLHTALGKTSVPENTVSLLLECRALLEEIIRITNTKMKTEGSE